MIAGVCSSQPSAHRVLVRKTVLRAGLRPGGSPTRRAKAALPGAFREQADGCGCRSHGDYGLAGLLAALWLRQCSDPHRVRCRVRADRQDAWLDDLSARKVLLRRQEGSGMKARLRFRSWFEACCPLQAARCQLVVGRLPAAPPGQPPAQRAIRLGERPIRAGGRCLLPPRCRGTAERLYSRTVERVFER